jgi:ATP-dependent exoDNAse (exonuclease V) beta subunit
LSPTLSDAAERRRALDPARSFIVQAPAGSGKTELLIRRFLVLLARVEHPEAVVAITFTIKAAGEMRDRVLRALRAARDQEEPASAHEAETWRLGRAVLDRDLALGWNLSEHPERLQIRTIDALCASITRRMPVTAGFGAQPELREDAVDLYVEAARRTLALLETTERSSTAIAALLRYLDGNVNRAEQLLVDMLPKRDQWLRHISGGWDIADPNEIRAGLERNLAAAIDEVLGGIREHLSGDCEAELMRLARFAARNSEDLSDLDGRRELPRPVAAELPAWCALRNLLLTANDAKRRSKLDRRQGFPPGCREKDDLTALIASLSDECVEALHEVRYLPEPRYNEEQWSAVRALLEVLPVAAAQLRLVFRDHGAIDFNELAQGARNALGSPEMPTELAFALDCRIEHILVDEFQDTSATQRALLERLTGGWTEGDGRTLFCVGDPMQSIFRFREAEVGVFLRARSEGLGALRLEPVVLSANFRADAELVQWNNETFRGAFAERESVATGAIPYVRSEPMRTGTSGVVAVHPLLGEAEAEEADTVVRLVQEALGRDREGTVAVLFRARRHARLIATKLRDAGVRYQAVDMNSLVDSVAVEDLLALTRALLHPADRIAWLAVLRGPCCGLALADLAALTEGDAQRTVLELAADGERLAALTDNGHARLERVMGVLAPILRDRARLPLRRWVESCWLRLGGPATVRSAAELGDAEVFLSLLEDFDVPDWPTLYRRMETLYAGVDPLADGRLQLLTMHKAKGLEFDTVIVPGLGRLGRSEDTKLLAWVELPTGLVLAPIAGAAVEKDALVQWLSRMDRRKTLNEELRLLYVAATRARHELHLIGNAPVKQRNGEVLLGEPDGRSLLRHIWPTVRPQFEQKFAGHAAAAAAETTERQPVTIRRLSLEWRIPDAPTPALKVPAAPLIEAAEEPVTFLWAGDTLRLVGTAVHATLQRIAGDGSQSFDAARSTARWRRMLVELAVPESELGSAVERVRRAVMQTLADERGRWILTPHQSAQTEYALSGVVNGRVRHIKVDRTFIDEYGVRWIIDYKTGTHEGGDVEGFLDSERRRYEVQLRGYAELLAAIENRAVRMGLYFPLLGGWREWGFEVARAV